MERQIVGIEQTLIPLTELLLRRPVPPSTSSRRLIEDAFLHIAEPERQSPRSDLARSRRLSPSSTSPRSRHSGRGPPATTLRCECSTGSTPLCGRSSCRPRRQGREAGRRRLHACVPRPRRRGPVLRSQLQSANLADGQDLPAIPRVGINAGPVLYARAITSAVPVRRHLTRRELGHARSDPPLTEPVAVAADKAGIEVEELGVRMIRGVDDPLPLYRVHKPYNRSATLPVFRGTAFAPRGHALGRVLGVGGDAPHRLAEAHRLCPRQRRPLRRPSPSWPGRRAARPAAAGRPTGAPRPSARRAARPSRRARSPALASASIALPGEQQLHGVRPADALGQAQRARRSSARRGAPRGSRTSASSAAMTKSHRVTSVSP